MRRTKRKSIIVTERDESLLRYLFVNKVAAVVDIQKDIFDNANLKTVHNRLKKLSDAKLIDATVQRERRNRLAYFVTKLGFKKYVADDGAAKRVQLMSDSIEHDLTILQLKRRFRRFKNVINFYSENLVISGLMDEEYPELRNLGELRPDAVVKLKFKDKVYFLPLEYEASAKSERRIAKLFSKYYTSPYVPAVLFISKTGTIEKKMLQSEAARGPDKRTGRFYYAQLEDALNAQEKLPFGNVKYDILTFS